MVDKLGYVDYSVDGAAAAEDSVAYARVIGAMPLSRELPDNSQYRQAAEADEEDTGKAEGFNLLEGGERQEYMLDHAGYSDEVRDELDRNLVRGAGHEEAVERPEEDPMHKELSERNANYRVVQLESNAIGRRLYELQLVATTTGKMMAARTLALADGMAKQVFETRKREDDMAYKELRRDAANPARYDEVPRDYRELLDAHVEAVDYDKMLEREDEPQYG